MTGKAQDLEFERRALQLHLNNPDACRKCMCKYKHKNFCTCKTHEHLPKSFQE